MKSIIILGAGGLGKEIVWLIEEINETRQEWEILGFLDSHPSVTNMELLGYKVLGPFEDAYKYPEAHFIIAFGDPRMRENVIKLVSQYNLKWATLISPTVRVHRSNKLGIGVVIGRYTDLTVECIIGNHVMLNIHVVLGHKVEIGDFSIVSPNVTLNGGAKIGKSCSIGANAFVRDVTIEDYVTVGASSCVIKPVESNCVVAGIPAAIIRKGAPVHSVTKILREEREQALKDSSTS
jgi:sugar O-acyltransferase (sialic acid O-acetyltransferase NeuD family)